MQFTQLDMELAFMDSNAIMSLAEELIATVLRQVRPLFTDTHMAYMHTLELPLQAGAI